MAITTRQSLIRTIKENLLVQFSIAALLVLAVMLVGTGWVMKGSFKDLVLHEVEADAVAASHLAVANFLTVKDLRDPMTGQRYDEFNSYVQANIVSERTARIKVWSREGQVMYSSEKGQVGRVFPVKEDLGDALEGNVRRELISPEEAEKEEDRGLGAMVEVYTPIRLAGSTEISGAFEIYQFWQPYSEQLNMLNNMLYGAMMLGGSLLYLSLFLIVRSGWHTILRQKKVEKERRTLESIMASMGEGLVVADAGGTVAYCNPAAEELLRIPAADIVGKSASVYHGLLSKRIVEPENWRDQVRQGLNGDHRPGKMRVTVESGGRREVEGTLFTIEAEGKRLGTGAVLRDITKEREVDRMKTELISIASHELRTPLTAVLGFSELLLLKARNMEERHRSWVQMIHDESKRLTDMIEEMLSASRIESGRLPLKTESVDFKSVATEVVEQLQPGSPKHILSLEVQDPLPAIRCDREKLYQVLYNLVGNAVKYSPSGGPVIVAARAGKAQEGIVISVSDHGLGIPQEEIPRLFNKFHRVQRPEMKGIRGTGLGLYIVKSTVEAMDGRIWVHSEVNRGSTFYVSLPEAAAAAPVPQSIPDRPAIM